MPLSIVMELIRTHDALFKFVFGEPEHLADLLRAVLPASVAAAFDWTTLRPVPGSCVALHPKPPPT